MTLTTGIVDCNNFYASSERLFDPRLKGHPVVVLSNNDGCVVARSNEAKELGIKNGVPLFQIQELVESENVAVFSSNYALYDDLSNRVMDVLVRSLPRVEVYSVDEAFVKVPGARPSVAGLATRQEVMEWVGVPVSIGLAGTKTLAKLAVKVAKKAPWTYGVFDFSSHYDQSGLLDRMPVSNIWGIGPKYAAKLNGNRIFSALDLRNACDRWVKQHLTITGLRTVHELRGTTCIPFESTRKARQGITSSRSFGEAITTLSDLKAAIATYTARAAEKLREEDEVASVITAFITTKHFGRGPHYSNAFTLEIGDATDYTPTLIRYALSALSAIYRPGYRYKKGGVMLRGLRSKQGQQASLFDKHDPSKAKLMETIDDLNRRYGKNAVTFGAMGGRKKAKWNMQVSRRSPRYTTRWGELKEVAA